MLILQSKLRWTEKKHRKVNAACMLQPLRHTASQFNYTGSRMYFLHAEDFLLHHQSWCRVYHSRYEWAWSWAYSLLPLGKILEKSYFCLLDKHLLSIISFPSDCFAFLKPWASVFFVQVKKREEQLRTPSGIALRGRRTGFRSLLQINNRRDLNPRFAIS